MLGEDPINGELKYGTVTVLNLPGKNAVINAENKDYSQRIE